MPILFDWELFQEELYHPGVHLGFHDSYVPTSSFEMQETFNEVITLDQYVERGKAESLAKKTPFMYFREVFPNEATQSITQQICKDGRIAHVSRVSVGGEEFVGEGRSKQLSKHAMARSVLAKFCPLDLQYLQQLKGETDMQTCNNVLADGLPLEQGQELEQTVAEPIQTNGSSSHLLPSTELASKPACQLLRELCQRNSGGSLPVFEVTKLENNEVACKITIGERSVEVVSKGRKVAKNLAATKALRELLNVEPEWLEKAESERNKAAIIGLDAQHALLKLCTQKCIPIKFHSEKSAQPNGQMKVVCQVGEEIFEAVGSKRKVRTLVSTKALKKLFDIDYDSFAGAGASYQVHPIDMQTKTPSQLLNELLTSQGHSPVEYAEAQTFQEGLGFRASAKFNDEEYEGWAPSKKKAKQEVARSILSNAFKVSFPNAE
uniref:DRBM domain-containing protein n=2 Tax=Trichuris muris TaxID=70415 RepID=A0A5S6R3Y7_TRIMR